MLRVRILILMLLAIVALGAGCREEAAPVVERPVFGDGTVDASRVVARVGDDEITEQMLDMRFEELNRQEKARYNGPEGRRLFLRYMVDELISVREAERRMLTSEPVVARVLIAQRREALNLALRAQITRDLEPTIDQVREYFEAHRDDYRRLGAMSASHIECATREAAQKAYAEVVERHRAFGTVAAQMSINDETRLNGGDLGWFNRDGYIPYIKNSGEFTQRIWDLKSGVNEPVEFMGHWHVVKVGERQYERLQTLEEAYDRVVADMLPAMREAEVDTWSREARAEASVEYFGEFRPGHGKSAKELLERAYYTKDPREKINLLGLLVDDYPDSELADDALFVAANVSLDTWGDRREAGLLLRALVTRYPESVYVDDANYMLENMHKPGMVNPKSIEELRQIGQ
jgi:peptidyl-prolyl cis-trans isomerase C